MLNKSQINKKRKVLNKVKAQLKTEFFGLDNIIDKVVDSLTAWYIFPEIITRPVIVNLWGMTGVGKTQLVRRLVSLLEYQDKFVEVTMDGSSTTGYWSNTISSILSQSTIDEGQPGILLLDEIQRFRTVDETGCDIKVERYQDVWTLLSDGKFSSDSSTFKEIEMMILQQQYDAGKFSQSKQEKDPLDDDDDDEDDRPRRSRKGMYPYEATNLKKTLRLSESIEEIMTWDTMDIAKALENIKSSRTTWEIDYTKLVIFISGNLDTAFAGADNTEDCDTDADFYHKLTKNITTSQIKGDLTKRFRPEQVARMGNNHIIYPSMSRESYERLIKSTCDKYINEITSRSNVGIKLHQNVLDAIYDNSVYPTQGTRPVFTSIHKIFSNLLVNLTFWGIEHGLSDISIAVNPDMKTVTATADTGKIKKFPIELEITNSKKRASDEFKTLVAVHEAGHAVAYSMLTKCAPFEVKVNTASFSGGYMLSDVDELISKNDLCNKIQYILAGRAAENMVFGPENSTTGAQSDLAKATEYASNFVRYYSFDSFNGLVMPPNGPSPWLTYHEKSNDSINELIGKMAQQVTELLNDNREFLQKLVDRLLDVGTVSQEEFVELASEFVELSTESHSLFSYSKAWQDFSKSKDIKLVA